MVDKYLSALVDTYSHAASDHYLGTSNSFMVNSHKQPFGCVFRLLFIRFKFYIDFQRLVMLELG